MAKKARKNTPANAQSAAITMTAAAEARLENFADDLGTLLGHAQNKADSWLGQRKAIAEQLVGVRDTAVRLLAQLGIAAEPKPARAAKKTSGRPAAKATGVKKKRTMSVEARAKIAAAQRARWAKQKRAKD